MLKNKWLLLAPIIAILVMSLLSLTQIPSAKQGPKNLPIALVNEDTGVEIPNQGHANMGETIAANLEASTKKTEGNEDPAVKWISVSSAEKAMDGMDNQQYFGAIVIPKDFSQKQASLQTPNPSAPVIQAYVNQGMNQIAANAVTQILNGAADAINEKASAHLVEGLKKQNAVLTADQAALIASPISKEIHNVHETGTQGNAPASLFQPLWMGSISAALILWNAMKKKRHNKATILAVQVLTAAAAAILVGFGLAWLAGSMLGFDIPAFTDTALFLALACFTFILMILAVLSWIGLAGMPIFILLLFFGGPLLAMAPEFMPVFYQDWIFSWLPMRFMTDGLRDLFFFSKEWNWNHPTAVLTCVAIGGVIVLALSLFKKKPETETIAQDTL
ncbi:YhgE/Pip domain-containing protein [Bacillus massiliglaciei]|uniref:YhgE/Pip domain-containing protein n=1 Tax=Bacillus massiliglaciei TaxID=1816693 RepID=UPI000DA5FA24|nr:DUF3533 domain-containing protein [Bacillus massiliglaciei]